MQCNFYIHVSFLGAVKECDVIDIPPSTPHIRGSTISALPMLSIFLRMILVLVLLRIDLNELT